ncbi:MAG: sigma 54-interacting transcriptional regulator [Kiritimatiellae bacterium]|nr:sigma 54-interacting transcriptional regulator [Kiritimatiellia bacterium]
MPVVIKWDLPLEPSVNTLDHSDAVSYREARDELHRLVEYFCNHGVLSALLTSGAHTRTVLDSVHDGIIAHDLERRICYVNAAAERISGYSRKEAMGKDCHDVFPGNLCSGKCLFCDPAVLPSLPQQRNIAIATKSGERRQVDMTVYPVNASDGSEALAGVMAVFRDQTREHRLARRAREIEHFAGIIGRDDKMLEIFDLISDLADSSVPVLIQGDSGTGKELIAAAIHNEGPRANQLFVPVNCGALPESLLESELFGHTKGAFTGAIRDKKGRFELADGGTIFLDEIGDISLAMQVKLLRVLQEGTFERVGSEETITVNVRVISATNKNLEEEIETGRFREDLYYRLNVVPIFVPPLRERRNDIPLLVNHVLAQVLKDTGKDDVQISDEAMDMMLNYDWPGNVRELQNWIQFALVKCRGGTIDPEHMPPTRSGASRTPTTRRRRQKLDDASVRSALREAGGNKVAAAKLLGVSRATLYRFFESRE